MDLAAYETAALGIELGWRDARDERSRRLVLRVVHARGLEDVLVQIHVELLARDRLQYAAERPRADVAVNHLGARRRVELRGEQQLCQAAGVVRDLVVRLERGQPGRVRQQVP